MCEMLNIKIAVIKRIMIYSPMSIQHNTLLISLLLGCEVSEEIVNYVVERSQFNIYRDISLEVPIAIVLDNLKPNLNSK